MPNHRAAARLPGSYLDANSRSMGSPRLTSISGERVAASILALHVCRMQQGLVADTMSPGWCRYSELEPMAAAWQEYAHAYVNQQGNPASKLTFIGCKGCVCRSRNPMLLHQQGIIAKETRTAWHIMSGTDRVVVCPKATSDWQFSIAGRHMILSGPSLMQAAG